MSDGLAARRAALDLISAVTGEGRMLSDAAPALTGSLAPEDRARATRLATDTLRWANRADRVLGPYLRQRPAERTHDALRLGVLELRAQGAAAHGVVNDIVTLLKERPETARQAGLANAILRKVATDDTWDSLPVPVLPKWLRKRLVAAWGKDATTAIETAHAAGAPLDLTVRPGGTPPPDATELPTGSWRRPAEGQVSALPGFETGDWWVQDAAAALPARLLGNVAGQRVIDLCAAPGGKTLQLAAAGADVTALDISPRRMERLTENLARTGLSARPVIADALEWTPEVAPDAILLDAPCSATGTIRRHPDLPHLRTEAEIDTLTTLQSRLIDQALGWLAPGGRLVFCTCSLLPEEGEAQLAAALARHPGLSVVSPDIPGIPDDWRSPGGGLRTRPDFWADRGGMDGFFMALLQIAA